MCTSTPLARRKYGYISGYGKGCKVLPDFRDVDRKDLASQWVGAWWIGFLIAGGLALLAAIPMFGFPKRLPGALKARMLDAVESGRSEEGDSKGKAKTTVLRSLRVSGAVGSRGS